MNRLLFFIASTNIIIINVLFLAIIGSERSEIVIADTPLVLSFYTNDDSWGPMTSALNYFNSTWGSGAPSIYQHVFFDHSTKFQYPPSSLFISSAMLLFGFGGQSLLPYAIIGFMFIVMIVFCTYLIVEYLLPRETGNCRLELVSKGLQFLLIAILCITFYPITSAYLIGQIQIWLDALFSLALLLWISDRKALCGVVIAIMCCIKPQFALFLAWGIVSAQWRFVRGLAASVALALIASILVFGIQNHLDYLRVLSAIAHTGESFSANQSLNGLLNRLMSVTHPVQFNNLEWSDNSFPPYTPWIYRTVLISSAMLIVASLTEAYKSRNTDMIRSFCIAALTCTMASPVAWGHHYGIMFSVFFLLFVELRRQAHWMVGSTLIYLVMSNTFRITDITANSYFNFIQSYVFFAGIGLLLVLYFSPRWTLRSVASVHSR